MTRQNVPAELLSDVKNYLNITWEDPATDAKVCGLIASAATYLDSKLYRPANYTLDGLPRTLLMEYVRYANDSALDVFENNYQALILAAQNESVVYRNDLESTCPAQNG